MRSCYCKNASASLLVVPKIALTWSQPLTHGSAVRVKPSFQRIDSSMHDYGQILAALVAVAAMSCGYMLYRLYIWLCCS